MLVAGGKLYGAGPASSLRTGGGVGRHAAGAVVQQRRRGWRYWFAIEFPGVVQFEMGPIHALVAGDLPKQAADSYASPNGADIGTAALLH